MTEFFTKCKNDNGEYEVVFKTTDRSKYKAMTKVCRNVIDGKIEKPEDVMHVKHGKWIQYSRNAEETYIECSECCIASRPVHLVMVSPKGNTLPKFCPNCAAMMESVERIEAK